MSKIRWNIFLLVYILSVQPYDLQEVEEPDKGRGSGSKCPFAPSSLTIGAVLYIARNKPK